MSVEARHVFSPLRISVHKHSPNSRYSKLKYNFRYWVKKYYGHPWFTILVSSGYSKFSIAVVKIEDKFIVIDVNPNFLPYPPHEDIVKTTVRAAFLKLYRICLENSCKGIYIDPELPFNPATLGITDLIGEIKTK